MNHHHRPSLPRHYPVPILTRQYSTLLDPNPPWRSHDHSYIPAIFTHAPYLTIPYSNSLLPYPTLSYLIPTLILSYRLTLSLTYPNLSDASPDVVFACN